MLYLLLMMFIASVSGEDIDHVRVMNLTKKDMPGHVQSGDLEVWVRNFTQQELSAMFRIRIAIPKPLKDVEPSVGYLQATVMNGQDAVAFSLPERIGNGSLIYETSRFLIPLTNEAKKQPGHVAQHQMLSVTVSTVLGQKFNYTLGVQTLSNSQYVVRPNQAGNWNLTSQKLGLSRPMAYFWDTTGYHNAKISIRSNDSLCGVLYLHNSPDNLFRRTGELTNLPNSSFRSISFSRRLDVSLDKTHLGDSLYIYLLLQPEDSLCDLNAPKRQANQKKSYTIRIATESPSDYWLPLTVYIGVFLASPALLFLYSLITGKANRMNHERLEDETPVEVDGYLQDHEVGAEEMPPANPLIDLDDDLDNSNLPSPESSSGRLRAEENPHSSIVESHGDVDHLHLHDELLPGVHNPAHLHVMEQTNRRSPVFDITFALYSLPALLLGFVQYNHSVDSSQLEDTCYHNYGCTKRWGPFVSFNHIVSNVGYILVSVIYTMFVYMRRIENYGNVGLVEPLVVDGFLQRGPFQNHGLEFAMGAALFCQGFASAIYHVCPNKFTFNFDTPFMEVISVAVMLKLYGNRRRVISTHEANIFLGSVIACNVMITIFQETFVRVLITFAHLISVAFFLKIISGQRYYTAKESLCSLKSSLFGILVVVLNVAVSLAHLLRYGLLQPNQVVTVLCIGNMILYLVYYLIQKIKAHERINKMSAVSMVISILLWIAAGYFFLEEETNWTVTPAQSRNLNKDCLLFNFFDHHDMWHLFSAEAALASLIALSTLDDQLRSSQSILQF